MRQEYQAIVQAGFLLQVDSPDLADLRTIRFWDLSLEAYREKEAQLNSVCARSRPTATTASTPRIGG
jgi:hypothetical protein